MLRAARHRKWKRLCCRVTDGPVRDSAMTRLAPRAIEVRAAICDGPALPRRRLDQRIRVPSRPAEQSAWASEAASSSGRQAAAARRRLRRAWRMAGFRSWRPRASGPCSGKRGNPTRGLTPGPWSNPTTGRRAGSSLPRRARARHVSPSLATAMCSAGLGDRKRAQQRRPLLERVPADIASDKPRGTRQPTVQRENAAPKAHRRRAPLRRPSLAPSHRPPWTAWTGSGWRGQFRQRADASAATL